MRKTLCVLVAIAAVSLMGARLLITQDEALVSGALQSLKFETVAGKPGVIGAPPKLKVTKETLDYLARLMKDGKVVEVQGNGSLKIVDAPK